MLELQGVSKSFDSKVILRDVHLRVAAGETFVLIGPSGVGKSVMLKILSGIILPDRGKVLVENQDLHALKSPERARFLRRMGMLFQKNALFDSLTCFENIAFPLRETTTQSKSEIQERVDYFIQAVGLTHARDLYPDEISGGMQKRLGIARALALEPEIIFYDDPTAGLDPITSRLIVQLILDLQIKNKSTIIAITNDMNRAFQLADRIGILTNGELIITGDESATRAFPNPHIQNFINGAVENGAAP